LPRAPLRELGLHTPQTAVAQVIEEAAPRETSALGGSTPAQGEAGIMSRPTAQLNNLRSLSAVNVGASSSLLCDGLGSVINDPTATLLIQMRAVRCIAASPRCE
jgi:hypothetical protein